MTGTQGKIRHADRYVEFWKAFHERSNQSKDHFELQWFHICQELESAEVEFPPYRKFVQVEIDVIASNFDDIDAYLDKIFKPIKEEAHRRRNALIRSLGVAAPFVSFDKFTDSIGRTRNWDDVFEIWEDTLKIFDLHQQQLKHGKSNYAQIARDMGNGWFPDEPDADNQSYPSRKVKKYLDLATRLIEAAGNGTFATEAVKPFPKGL